MILKVLSPMSKMRLPADGGSAIRIFWHCVTNNFFFNSRYFPFNRLAIVCCNCTSKTYINYQASFKKREKFCFLSFLFQPSCICVYDRYWSEIQPSPVEYSVNRFFSSFAKPF